MIVIGRNRPKLCILRIKTTPKFSGASFSRQSLADLSDRVIRPLVVVGFKPVTLIADFATHLSKFLVLLFGPLAQLVEQAAHNRSVVGSSPTRSIGWFGSYHPKITNYQEVKHFFYKSTWPEGWPRNNSMKPLSPCSIAMPRTCIRMGSAPKIVDINVELNSLIGGNTPGDVTSLNCDLGPWPRVSDF